MIAHVIVNGTSRRMPTPPLLGRLLAEQAPEMTSGIAAALNGAVVPRSEWACTPLTAGDRVEILVAAQGG